MTRWLAFNSGRGWGVWHYLVGQQRVRAICGREIPAKARVCFSENPPVEQLCLKCLEREKASQSA